MKQTTGSSFQRMNNDESFGALETGLERQRKDAAFMQE